MPIIDTGALVRPAFEAAEFTPTKWTTADEKAAFVKALCRFIALDYETTLFTDSLYRRLALSFGHIAHTNKRGFIATFFEDLRSKLVFIEWTLQWVPCGDPAWTYSDVERAVQARLRACDLLDAYRALHAAEMEGAERVLLKQLQAKYADGAAPTRAPVLHCSAPVRPRQARKPEDQANLF